MKTTKTMRYVSKTGVEVDVEVDEFGSVSAYTVRSDDKTASEKALKEMGILVDLVSDKRVGDV